MTNNDLSTKTVEELRNSLPLHSLWHSKDGEEIIAELARRASLAEKLSAEVDKSEDMAWNALGNPYGTHEASNVERLCQRVAANEALREAALLLAKAADQVCPTFDARGDASTQWSRELAPLIQSVRLLASAPINERASQAELLKPTARDNHESHKFHHGDGLPTSRCTVCDVVYKDASFVACKGTANCAPHDCDAMRELALLRSYIEAHHNGYGETGRIAGMEVPKSHLQALMELVEEREDMRDALRDDKQRTQGDEPLADDGVDEAIGDLRSSLLNADLTLPWSADLIRVLRLLAARGGAKP